MGDSVAALRRRVEAHCRGLNRDTAEDRNALLQLYRQTHEELLSVLDGLTGAQLTEQTLDGWSVTDHDLHLACRDDIRVGRGRAHIGRARLVVSDDRRPG